jgi:choline dehydrogenase-like flavoprotein
MGSDPRTSVADGFGRTHDIPNLFVCDGSLLPTQGSANPGLTIQALAARTADYLVANRANVLSRDTALSANAHPPVRRDLSPDGTSGHGVPRWKTRHQVETRA